MRIYEFRIKQGLTDHFHSGGGAMVFAENETEARRLLANKAVSTNFLLVDSVKEVGMSYPKVIIFPDAGCC
jgi:hypothetical protein